MSTYIVNPIDPKFEILAGWDPGMSTYFAHVIDTSLEEETPGRDVLWIGCSPNEIGDVDTIVSALMPHMDYDAEELFTSLYRDANT